MTRKTNKNGRRQKKTVPLDSAASVEALLKDASAIRHYSLRLYVTGTTNRSLQAIATIRALCEEVLPGKFDLEVVDIYQQPMKALDEQIIAAPTLIKRRPRPQKRFIGNLSDRRKLLIGLNLRSSK